MSDTITIRIVENGYVLVDTDGAETVVEHRDEESTARAFLSLVYVLQDALGVTGSRYDAERFWAELRPGDKYEPESKWETVQQPEKEGLAWKS
jgi:hypothetical protein